MQLFRADGSPIVGGIVAAIRVNGKLVPAPPRRENLPGIDSSAPSTSFQTFRNGIDWAHDEDGWTTVNNRRRRAYRFEDDEY